MTPPTTRLSGPERNGTTYGDAAALGVVPPDERGYCPSDDELANPLIAGALDNTAFDAADFAHAWLIRDLLVRDEPAVVAAASKTMKTAIIVDLAVSLAGGKPFLGTFPVPDVRRVFVLSAESGPASLRARMRQVCQSKQLDPRGLAIQWYTRIETLATVEGCANLEAALRHFRSEVVVLDPTYLLLGGEVTADSAGNMFAMGGLLAAVGNACLNAGATPIVVTHANSRVPVGEPMELPHIAWSGFQQWARQWWLLSRRRPYDDDGRHELFMRYGGSAGHTGLLCVDIDEGTGGPGGTGKRWDVRAVAAGEFMQRAAEQAARAKEEKAREKAAERERQERERQAEKVRAREDRQRADVEAVYEELVVLKGKALVSDIAGKLAWPGGKVRTCMASLLRDGRVKPVKITRPAGRGGKATTKRDGFAAVKPRGGA